MEKTPDDREPGGVDVGPYAEIEVTVPAPDSDASLALYEVQRERGADPTEPMESLLRTKLEREGRTLAIERDPVDVAAYAEIDVPTPEPDSPAHIALRAVQRQQTSRHEDDANAA